MLRIKILYYFCRIKRTSKNEEEYEEDDYDYSEDSDFQNNNKQTTSYNFENQVPTDSSSTRKIPHQYQHSSSRNSNGHSANRKSVTLSKICSQNQFNNQTTTVRSFLIKSYDKIEDFEDLQTNNKTKTNAVINYFIKKSNLEEHDDYLNQIMYGNGGGSGNNHHRLFDFKLSYEFLNFDWFAYQEYSVCDFVYDFSNSNNNRLMPLSGYIENPQASIFYKSNDEFLKCKFRFISKPNQFIKLTVEKIDFDQNECENSFLELKSTQDRNEEALLNKKCESLDKRLVIRDSKTPQSSNMNNFYYYDNYETKFCLCKPHKSTFKHVYMSKYDSLEVKYEIRLNSHDTINKKVI